MLNKLKETKTIAVSPIATVSAPKLLKGCKGETRVCAAWYGTRSTNKLTTYQMKKTNRHSIT